MAALLAAVVVLAGLCSAARGQDDAIEAEFAAYSAEIRAASEWVLHMLGRLEGRLARYAKEDPEVTAEVRQRLDGAVRRIRYEAELVHAFAEHWDQVNRWQLVYPHLREGVDVASIPRARIAPADMVSHASAAREAIAGAVSGTLAEFVRLRETIAGFYRNRPLSGGHSWTGLDRGPAGALARRTGDRLDTSDPSMWATIKKEGEAEFRALVDGIMQDLADLGSEGKGWIRFSVDNFGHGPAEIRQEHARRELRAIEAAFDPLDGGPHGFEIWIAGHRSISVFLPGEALFPSVDENVLADLEPIVRLLVLGTSLRPADAIVIGLPVIVEVSFSELRAEDEVEVRVRAGGEVLSLTATRTEDPRVYRTEPVLPWHMDDGEGLPPPLPGELRLGGE